jgi:hypothetical protein
MGMKPNSRSVLQVSPCLADAAVAIMANTIPKAIFLTISAILPSINP